MKLVRYDRNGAVRLGALDGDLVVDLLDACPTGTPTGMIAALSDMTRLIEAGEDGLKAARAALANAQKAGTGRVPLAKAKLKAPLDPVLILCSGENYWDHRDEKPEVTRKDPEFFLKTGLGVIGPGEDILRDERVTRKLDYETELLIVIGRPGRHIPRARAGARLRLLHYERRHGARPPGHAASRRLLRLQPRSGQELRHLRAHRPLHRDAR